VSRGPRLALLAVLGAGVFLAGLELMVTATALPSILADLADWTRLREASWIINAYLVAYVAMMPLAGRLADRYGVMAPFSVALVAFGIGSALSGAAQTLEWLIAARVLQGLGGGALVPLATAGASHLFDGRARARALGIIGALTFLGMAAGPFVGAAVLGMGDLRPALQAGGFAPAVVSLVTPAWRWVFYLDVPASVVALLYAWAAAPAWDAPRTVAPTWAGSSDAPGGGEGELLLVAVAAGTLVAALVLGARSRDTLLDPRRYLEPVLGGAVLVSGLTGYALATGLIGGAVFVDRVLYGGPPDQRVALGGLAAAMAVGALVSGFVVGRAGVVAVSLVGLIVSAAAMALLGRLTQLTGVLELAALLSLFGFGFGLTVSPRSVAAVEAAGRAAFGVASAAVTVARMLGMAVGLAVLTALGSGRIEALTLAVNDQAYRDSLLPVALRGRPLQDGLVVDWIERWAAGQGAAILDSLFALAAIVTLVAVAPALAMGRPSGRRERAGQAGVTLAFGAPEAEREHPVGDNEAGGVHVIPGS
jgi:MFS family permease